ncbi:unnamed protein product, partial [Polarella glacialis]
YITYSFNVDSCEEPQEPVPVGGRGKIRPPLAGAAWGDVLVKEAEAQRLASVPKRFNEVLAQQRREAAAAGSRQASRGMELVSGQLEFVLDEADGALWLVNATRLRCRYLPEAADQEVGGTREEEEVMKFFEEDEFAAQMKDHEVSMSRLKKRFGGDPGVACGGRGALAITVSDADRFAGVKAPSHLVNYYDEEEKMLRYYVDEVRALTIPREKKWVEGTRAVGLACWFRRWVRGVRGRPTVRSGPRQSSAIQFTS